VKRMLACCLFAGANLAAAQALQDPTRPPANLIARQAGGRHIAVIDGETLRIGDSYQGARVTRIEQNEVELGRGNARQVLKLNAAMPANAGAIERVRTE
jgi:MSHA biogenesis protein MshK